MSEVLTPLSIWIQLANFFFMVSGLHGDLLIIRFALFLAYFMLVLNSILGSPLWPFTSGEGIRVDGLVWSSLSLYVHGSSLFALIQDEREVELSEDEAALWRMMYRTGGLSRRLFQSIVAQKLSVVDIPAGQTVDTKNFFYIIYNGQVRLQVVERNVSKSSTRILVSGETFDLKMIGFFSEKSVFDKGSIRCTTLTSARLFRIAKDDMKKMSHHPLAKGVWQALLINNLSYAVESYLSEEHRSIQAELCCDKMFRPLESWEQPKPSLSGSGLALANPLLHLAGCVQNSFSPPWPFSGHHPTGIRQTLLPRPPPQRPAEAQAPPRFHRFSIRRLSTRTSNNVCDGNTPSTTDDQSSIDDSMSDTPSRSGTGLESVDMREEDAIA
jgi:hypothetical protein